MTRLTPAVFALLGSTFAASAALAAAGSIPAAPPAPVAVVQAGDRDLSCQAIAEQLATLAQTQARKTEQAAHGRRMFGFATAALQMAAPLAGNLGGSGASGLIGAVAQQGAMTAMQTAASQPATDTVPADTAARHDRLEALFDAKGC